MNYFLDIRILKILQPVLIALADAASTNRCARDNKSFRVQSLNKIHRKGW